MTFPHPDRSAHDVVRVWLLGGFRVSAGSRTIGADRWQRRKAAALVKLLALAPRHRMHREQVMNLLWPHLGEQAAANNLHRTLYVARRALEPNPPISSRYLSLRGEQLSLCPERDLWVDVEAFEQAAAAALRSRDPAAYRAALDLYAGELLPEDRYEEWAQSCRERLHVLLLSLLVQLARVYESSEELGLAAEAFRRAVAADSVAEEAHVGLMRLYVLSGREGEALRQYQRLEDALRREFGTEPGVSARRLREEIVARHSSSSPSSVIQSPESDCPTREAAWAEESAMSAQGATEDALLEEVFPASKERPPARERTDRPLTRREWEVAGTVARGLCNRQIASELHLSARTVEHHIAKILRKLGFASRAQIAVWVTEQRLVGKLNTG